MEEPLTEKQRYFRQYYRSNKDKYRAKATSYYHQNRERMMKYYRECYAQWYAENKEQLNTRRRAKRRQLAQPTVRLNVTIAFD